MSQQDGRRTQVRLDTTHVLYEDNHLLIVNKPAGMLAQGDHTGDTPLVEHGKAYIKSKYHKPGEVFLGVVHRLDRPVSGVVVLARTSKALTRMNRLFQEKKTEKTYWALVEKPPSPETGTLIHWLTKDPKKNRVAVYRREVPGSKRAELSYRLVAQHDKRFLVEVTPRTGRPHQIRVQLASLGCPIRGDLKYGAPLANPDASISLHARCLKFMHPVRQVPLCIEAPLPEEAGWSGFSRSDH